MRVRFAVHAIRTQTQACNIIGHSRAHIAHPVTGAVYVAGMLFYAIIHITCVQYILGCAVPYLDAQIARRVCAQAFACDLHLNRVVLRPETPRTPRNLAESVGGVVQVYYICVECMGVCARAPPPQTGP